MCADRLAQQQSVRGSADVALVAEAVFSGAGLEPGETKERGVISKETFRGFDFITDNGGEIEWI